MDAWNSTYQLLPTNVHRINIAERDIRTFKAHFISVLAGVYPTFPKFMWDNLLTQTELTINLLQQATLNRSMSAWEYFNGAIDLQHFHWDPSVVSLSVPLPKIDENHGTTEGRKDSL